MTKLSNYIALMLLCLSFVTLVGCEKEEDRNVEVTYLPGQSVEIKSIFPKVSESRLNGFISDNPSVVMVKNLKIETLRPGQTKIHNGKCVADITIEPYDGPAPYLLPAGIRPNVTQEDVLQIMRNYGNPIESSQFYTYTFCRILTYNNFPGTKSISFYFDERLGNSDSTRKLVFITVEPQSDVSTTLAYLLTNCTLAPVSSNGATSILGGNRYLESPEGWYIKSENNSNWKIVKYCAPGYDFV